MCGHWKRADKHTLDPQRLKVFQIHAVLGGLETICYSGGDPLAYPHINEMMEFNAHNDIKFGLITAGYCPGSIDMGLLAKAEWIRVSLDSLDDATYNCIRGGDITASMVCDSVIAMANNSCNVQLGITLTKHNCEELPKLARFAVHTGRSSVSVWPVRNSPDLCAPTKYAVEKLFEARRILDNYGINNNFEDALGIVMSGEEVYSGRCYAPLFQLFIGADGNVFPCCIAAGDACNGAKGDALANISSDSVYGIMLAAYNFSNNFVRHPYCQGCTRRLQTISMVASKLWDNKHFI